MIVLAFNIVFCKSFMRKPNIAIADKTVGTQFAFHKTTFSVFVFLIDSPKSSTRSKWSISLS